MRKNEEFAHAQCCRSREIATPKINLLALEKREKAESRDSVTMASPSTVCSDELYTSTEETQKRDLGYEGSPADSFSRDRGGSVSEYASAQGTPDLEEGLHSFFKNSLRCS